MLHRLGVGAPIPLSTTKSSSKETYKLKNKLLNGANGNVLKRTRDEMVGVRPASASTSQNNSDDDDESESRAGLLGMKRATAAPTLSSVFEGKKKKKAKVAVTASPLAPKPSPAVLPIETVVQDKVMGDESTSTLLVPSEPPSHSQASSVTSSIGAKLNILNLEPIPSDNEGDNDETMNNTSQQPASVMVAAKGSAAKRRRNRKKKANRPSEQ